MKRFLVWLYPRLLCRRIEQHGWYQDAKVLFPSMMEDEVNGVKRKMSYVKRIYYYGRTKPDTLNSMRHMSKAQRQMGGRVVGFSKVKEHTAVWWYPIWSKPYWKGV